MPHSQNSETDPIAERAPLLGSDDAGSDSVAHQSLRNASKWQVKTSGTVVLLIAIIKFSVVTSGMMILIPGFRLIEDSLCHVYYQDEGFEPIEEQKCKVDGVQTELATLMGWFALLNSVISLTVAFPYGILADKIGRKPLAVIAYAGIAISFLFSPFMLGTNARFVRQNHFILLTGTLFQFLGGGVQVLMATLYAIAADVSDEKEKAANFLYLTFGATAGGLLGPLIAGLLMASFGPWIPIYIVIAMSPVVFGLFALLPETLVTIDAKPTNSDRSTMSKQSFQTHVRQGLSDLKNSLSMLKNVNVPLILVTFVSQNARITAYTGTLAQYVSKHYHWRFDQTSILLSPLGLLNLLVLAALPYVSKFLMSDRVGFSIFRKDLFLTRWSTVLLIIGALIEGASHNVVLFIFGLFVSTFGAADSPLARATISHYVAPEYTSRLYALIGMSEVIGSFIGGPVLAYFFNLGVKWKGVWIGLPWFYIAFTCIVCWIALLWVKPPKASTEVTEED